MRRRLFILIGLVSLASAVAAIAARDVSAISTRTFVIEDLAAFSAGELERASAFSDGTLRPGVDLRRIALADVPLVWSIARLADGAVVLGTGNDGKIFRVRGDQISVLGETRQLVVSSLAVGDRNTVYAGTLPEGRIFAIDAGAQNPQMREFSRPAGAEDIWALAWDARRNALIAATGPEGKIFSINARGEANVLYDAEASHVMSLAIGDDHAIYAGTSDGALLLRITGPGQAEVVHDFPGTEVTAIVISGNTVAVAANEFAEPAASTATPPASANTNTSARPSPPRPRAGKGRLFRIAPDGRVELILSHDDGHFTSVQIDGSGAIYAGVGKDGRIVHVLSDRTSATWIDVEEQKVLAIDLTHADPMFVTGDTGAMYRVISERPSSSQWTSKVLDAGFRARWGRWSARGEGAFEVQTRSGNVERPDTTWSAWSSAQRAAPTITAPASDAITSPAARFLQLRVRFGADPAALVRSITAYYLPQNQSAWVREITAARAPTKQPDSSASAAPEEPPPSPELRISWKIDNPDNDRLRYRLRFRHESQDRLRDMHRESDVITRTEHTWNTASVPDGWYRIRVEASDEATNPDARVLRASSESAPILVDNHAPSIVGLALSGRRITARAVDSLGPIAKFEIAIDGGEWRIAFPEDEVFDEASEDLAVDLPASIPAGSHIIAVRAFDAANNVVGAEITANVDAPRR